MKPIDKALALIYSQKDVNYTAVADKFGCNQSTLSRRHRGVTTSRENIIAIHHSLLSKAQQNKLVNYINRLSNKGIPPTILVVRLLAIDICKTRPRKCWTWRFIKAYSDRLDYSFLWNIDLARRKADSLEVYHIWFK
jgi:hypothetical protein